MDIRVHDTHICHWKVSINKQIVTLNTYLMAIYPVQDEDRHC